MGLLNDAAIFFSQLPLERWISKGPKRTEHWERLERALKDGELPRPGEGIVEPTHSLKTPEAPNLPPLVPNLGRTTENRGNDTIVGAAPRELATTEETITELKGRLAKEIYRFQLDLTAGCKIAGKPCDCCDKHPGLGLAALCEELLPMDPTNPIYQEIPAWYKHNAHKLSLEGSASGKYDAEYPLMSAEMRVFRKRLMGTENLKSTTVPNEVVPVVVERARASKPPPRSRLIPLTPRKRELGPDELEFFADSAEQVRDSMDRNGLGNGLDSAFRDAIAKANGGQA